MKKRPKPIYSRRLQGRNAQTIPPGTDGIWETHNESGEMFGKKRLTTLIRKNASSASENILHSIIESLKSFRGSVKQEDDVTLAVVKIVQ